MKDMEHNKLLELAIHASIEAGINVLDIYEKDFDVEFKNDDSPLTTADKASHQIIEKHLINTGIPVLSEEGKSIPYEKRKLWDALWIVDPLDGTKEFIKKNGEFTINIALIKNGTPVLGVIYIPVQHTLYFACDKTGTVKVENVGPDLYKASLNIFISSGNSLPLKSTRKIYTIVGSKSHLTPETSEYINKLQSEHGETEFLSRGSSLKICMVAEGEADIYPRFAPTMEWDTAAGHAIAKYAGVKMFNAITKEEMPYNTEKLVNPWFIVKR